MKVLDVGYKKEFVYDLYSRIIDDYKAYDKVTKKKMFEVITEFYSDYNNIIDLCTVREIKFLKKVAKGEDFDYRDDKYKERNYYHDDDYDDKYYKDGKYSRKRRKESFMGEIFDIFGGD